MLRQVRPSLPFVPDNSLLLGVALCIIFVVAILILA
jgi:hypothetical protein